jgi:pimeloyl-ACP methyl ester carboxylesterase
MLPAATVVMLPGCGHVPTWDDPALVARVMLKAASAG